MCHLCTCRGFRCHKAAYVWKDFKNIREEGTYSITRTGFEGVAYYGPDLVVDGSRLEARLTPESGYVLGIGDITVTMGGKKLDPMSKEFFYGTFGKDTLTIETVTGDVTITAKARKLVGILLSLVTLPIGLLGMRLSRLRV